MGEEGTVLALGVVATDAQAWLGGYQGEACNVRAADNSRADAAGRPVF